MSNSNYVAQLGADGEGCKSQFILACIIKTSNDPLALVVVHKHFKDNAMYRDYTVFCVITEICFKTLSILLFVHTTVTARMLY